MCQELKINKWNLFNLNAINPTQLSLENIAAINIAHEIEFLRFRFK